MAIRLASFHVSNDERNAQTQRRITHIFYANEPPRPHSAGAGNPATTFAQWRVAFGSPQPD
jgi:hypothetical protein